MTTSRALTDRRVVAARGEPVRSRQAIRAAVVEHDTATALLLEQSLTLRGHRVITCSDAESALVQHEQRPFELLVVDWELPGLDGAELCQKLRQRPRGDGLAVLIIAGPEQSADPEAVLRAGANDLLSRPIDCAQLAIRLAVAEHWLDERAREQRAHEQQARSRDPGLISERFASMGTLAAGLAHEINNPLTYVTANLDYLADALAEERPLSPERLSDCRQAMAETREGVLRVSRVVRDLRLLCGPGPVSADVLDLSQMIEAVRSASARPLEDAGELHGQAQIPFGGQAPGHER